MLPCNREVNAGNTGAFFLYDTTRSWGIYKLLFSGLYAFLKYSFYICTCH